MGDPGPEKSDQGHTSPTFKHCPPCSGHSSPTPPAHPTAVTPEGLSTPPLGLASPGSESASPRGASR